MSGIERFEAFRTPDGKAFSTLDQAEDHIVTEARSKRRCEIVDMFKGKQNDFGLLIHLDGCGECTSEASKFMWRFLHSFMHGLTDAQIDEFEILCAATIGDKEPK